MLISGSVHAWLSRSMIWCPEEYLGGLNPVFAPIVTVDVLTLVYAAFKLGRRRTWPIPEAPVQANPKTTNRIQVYAR